MNRTTIWMTSTAAWLVPSLAWAHGGHGELGAGHGLWHVMPLVGAAILGAAWAYKAARARR